MTCEHLQQVEDVEPNTTDGCEQCLAAGTSWVHLRLCMTCGHVGCCDSSPERHARKHAAAADHPVVMSFEPEEDWLYCWPDDAFLARSPRVRSHVRS